MKRIALALVALFFAGSVALGAPQRSFNFLTTGNGYGFQVFDIAQDKLVRFLSGPTAICRRAPIRTAPGSRRATSPTTSTSARGWARPVPG